jgi:hypothetical protein
MQEPWVNMARIYTVEEKANNLRIIEEIISVGEWSCSRYIYAG